MGQGSTYRSTYRSMYRRCVRAGNTRVSETSFGRKNWKVELSSQTIIIQKQSSLFWESCLMNDMCIWVIFLVMRSNFFLNFIPPQQASRRADILAFQQGCPSVACSQLPSGACGLCPDTFGAMGVTAGGTATRQPRCPGRDLWLNRATLWSLCR